MVYTQLNIFGKKRNKMKFLYVCTSSNTDFFLEQTFVSIVTLKLNTPNAFVSLLIDKATEKTLVNDRKKIKDIVDEITVIDLDESLSAQIRSRLLKTSMRHHIQGDFLFIDSDTIILSNLEEINQNPNDLAGVLDCHTLLHNNPQIQIHSHIKKMKNLCSDRAFLNNELYFNSGVLLVRDSNENHSFFKMWHELYKKHQKQNNIIQDQPTLALTNFKSGNVIKELDGTWNCQLNYGTHLFRSAKILHFFASVNIPKAMQNMYKKVRQLAFSQSAVSFIERYYETAAFDFGSTALVKGAEYKVLNTALYRFLIYTYSSHKKLYNFFEKIASLGRGHGFYYKTKKG